MSLTGNKEIDRQILLRLDDKDLGIVCRVNKKVNQLCQEPIFWINKIMQKFKIENSLVHWLKDFLEFDDYKELYKYLNNNVIFYIKLALISPEKLRSFNVYNNILMRLDNNIFPKYINKKLFIIDFKRKLFEGIDEYFTHNDENIVESYNFQFNDLIQDILLSLMTDT